MESRVDQMDARIRDLEPSIGRGQVSGKKQIMNFPEEKDEAQSCSRYPFHLVLCLIRRGQQAIFLRRSSNLLLLCLQRNMKVLTPWSICKQFSPAQVPPVLVKVPPVLVKVPPVLVKVPHVPVQVPPVPAQAQKGSAIDGVVHQTLGGFGRARAYRGVNPTNVANVVRPRVEVSQPGLLSRPFHPKKKIQEGCVELAWDSAEISVVISVGVEDKKIYNQFIHILFVICSATYGLLCFVGGEFRIVVP
uniref:Uncharacterized protein n=1 Tax=Ditylenchus dipsaci TaxID=166011 RepID=A0A915CX79_9BILA